MNESHDTDQHFDRGNISLEVTNQEAPFSVVNALKVVQSPTNPAWVSTRDVGKKTLSYVSGDVVIRLLNKAFNYRWSYEVLETRIVDSIDKDLSKYNKENQPQTPVVQSLGRLTVPGWGVREQWGSQVILAAGSDVQANAFKGAATDAMKKCASSFGIGLDLYGQQGINELRVTPQDILTDDDEVLNKFRDKIEKELEEQGKKVVNHAPAELDPDEVDADTDMPKDSAPAAAPSTPVADEPAPTDAPASPTPAAAPENDEPKTDAPKADEPKAKVGSWRREDIEAMIALKERLGIPAKDNSGLDPYIQEFFNDETATFKTMITPNNVKDFLHFMATK